MIFSEIRPGTTLPREMGLVGVIRVRVSIRNYSFQLFYENALNIGVLVALCFFIHWCQRERLRKHIVLT
ncbi:hypothetical protein GSU3491 [Geobacter sulfurreducens PCA]|uniref:Uncharacterized protein n=1 Tax=Geobacter sulfurreducens (strain ATCC 51573 / DSM 12127 / PCA) TaxID=243231 RepID=I7FK59_GEOSL|nr:hypothetical protein GSU3491 [Geobacter sulfurreducens PCA]HBB68629.1 hypothetical protein [Geobacter sulfurreducens]HCD96444.1 hypothetical protein [Geobacter sulfurreducens]